MFSVGDIIEATTEFYGITCKSNDWVGKVIHVDGNRIYVETISCLSNEGFTGSVNPEFFKLHKETAIKYTRVSERTYT